MAIHPSLQPHIPNQSSLTPQQALTISAWTEQATTALQNLDISALASNPTVSASDQTVQGASVSLTIPLDEPPQKRDSITAPRARVVGNGLGVRVQSNLSSDATRREISRRDSLKRREALLKGKEGSRRRQRWENARLLSNPWVQPPSAQDWLIQPTYPRRTVPYYLAQYWDSHYANKEPSPSPSSKNKEDDRDQIPKELRKKLKYARAARGLLHDLEEDIRCFVQKWGEKRLSLREEGLEDAPSSSDSEDEIVFVGKNGQMHDSPARKERHRRMREELRSRKEDKGEKMVFESFATDHGAVFGRWLVYSIASYYGLYSWSITVGHPARREAYVGFHQPAPGSRDGQISFLQGSALGGRGGLKFEPGEPLPKPLWGQI